MTKTEYREYIRSEDWQARRKVYLLAYDRCNRCDLPRWLAVVAYDQDLHVHHRNYQHIGQELESDLESLCKRCHEIETFGSSNLHSPKSRICRGCEQELCWNMVDIDGDFCEGCKAVLSLSIGNIDTPRLLLAQLSPIGDPIASIRKELERAERWGATESGSA